METSQIASKLSPSFKIVSKYFIASIASFVLVNILLVLNYDVFTGHYFQPRILAIVHVTTLGWITMIIFGATFQLVPVVLEVKLFSELLAEIQFWIYLLGAAGLITGFWSFDTGIHLTASAILLAASMIIFIFNISASMIKVKKWNITGTYLAAAMFWLLSTAAAGLLLAINLGYPFIKGDHLQYLKLHVDVAFIGWVTMMIMGVTYKLIPMFSLSHGFTMMNANRAFILVNAGLLGITTVMHYQNMPAVYFIFIAMIVAGILFFLRQVQLILKKRLRKSFDVGMKHSVAAFIIMFAAAILGAALTFIKFDDIILEMNLTFVYGFSVLFGFFSMLTVGQLYKILPFLVWFHKYSSKVGIQKVPLLKEMYNENLANVEFYLMLAAVISTIIILGSGAAEFLVFSFTLMLLSSLLFAFNMISIFRK